MVCLIAKMLLCIVILCAMSCEISSTASPYDSKSVKLRLKDDFDFSSEEITDTYNQDTDKLIDDSKSTTSNPKDHHQDQVSDLLKEVGSGLPQKVYTNIYNDSTETRICLKTVTYVRDNLVHRDRVPWRVYEVIFDFPGAADTDLKIPTNNHTEYRLYRVRDLETGAADFLNFTVIETTENYTLSKHEKNSCGTGNFLTKIYYEWPGSDRKRVVVKLSDQPSGISDGGQNPDGHQKANDRSKSKADDGQRRSVADDENNRFENIGSKKTKKERGTKFQPSRDTTNQDSSEIVTKKPKTQDFRNLDVPNVLTQLRKNRNKSNGTKDITRKYHVEEHRDQDEDDLTLGASTPMVTEQSYDDDNSGYHDIFSVPERKGYADAITTSKGSSSSVNPCSPILTTLISGKILSNGIMPGLCSLKKNEKVVLRGDITVSKKYFDEENTEIDEPLYTILENTEIRALYKE